MTEENKISFAQQVWDTFSKIDVSDHTSKIEGTGNRPDLEYLNWARAIRLLRENYPDSRDSYQVQRPYDSEDAGWEVICTVSVEKDGLMVERSMDLPVMDWKNNAIVKPDSRMISDTKRRAFVKCMATGFGLGLSLWEKDEALPTRKPEYTEEQKDRWDDYINMDDAYLLYLMSKETSEKAWVSLYNSFEKGQKTEGKKKVNEMLDHGLVIFQDRLDSLKDSIANEDAPGALEVVDEWADFEKRWYWKHLDKLERDYLTRIKMEGS